MWLLWKKWVRFRLSKAGGVVVGCLPAWVGPYLDTHHTTKEDTAGHQMSSGSRQNGLEGMLRGGPPKYACLLTQRPSSDLGLYRPGEFAAETTLSNARQTPTQYTVLDLMRCASI